MSWIPPLLIIVIFSSLVIAGVVIMFKAKKSKIDSNQDRNRKIVTGMILAATAIIFAMIASIATVYIRRV